MPPTLGRSSSDSTTALPEQSGAATCRMHDLYMEISFHFESSVIPFVGKIALFDTYKIWKRDKNLHANRILAGFKGLKSHPIDQSFLFLGDGGVVTDIPVGSLLVLNRDDKKIFNAFENSGRGRVLLIEQCVPIGDGCNKSRTCWKNQLEKRREDGKCWKVKRVYEVCNVVFFVLYILVGLMISPLLWCE